MMKTLDEADRSPYLDGSASESESRAAARGAAASAAASTAQPAAANGTAVGRRKGTRGASGTDTVEDGHAEPAAKTVKLEEPEAKSASSGPTGTRRSVRGGRPLELHTPEMKVFKTLGFAPDDATVV